MLMQKQTKQKKGRRNRREGGKEREREREQRKNEPMCPSGGDECNEAKYRRPYNGVHEVLQNSEADLHVMA